MIANQAVACNQEGLEIPQPVVAGRIQAKNTGAEATLRRCFRLSKNTHSQKARMGVLA